MIALAYLIVMLLVGDAFARRWSTFTSGPHRLATAFLAGLLLSTWATYLLALAWANTDRPLLPANALFFALGSVVVIDRLLDWRRARPLIWQPRLAARRGWLALRGSRWDWGFMFVVAILVSWMAFTTFSADGEALRVGIHEYGDFGPNTAIAASFSFGHNLPTEYPLFAGQPILYHFLFYFQAGNLTFLGWDAALAGNVLFIGSMVSMLVVLVAIGERAFGSPAVGRLATVLFFAHGSLSVVPYLASFPSVSAALEAIPKSDRFLSSGFPYHGEEYAIWTQNVFLNQRHLASAIGVLLVVVLFVMDRVTQRFREARPRSAVGPIESGPALRVLRRIRPSVIRESVASATHDPGFGGYLACGLLLGLLPLWNGAAFVAAAAIMFGLLLMFPGRLPMLALGAAAAVVSIPQLLYLRPDGVQSTTYPAFHWGYVVADPTLLNVGAYIAFLFGPKLVLMGVALVRCSSLERRFFVAIAGPAVLAFTFQLSVDLMNNHKLLTLWLILANLFVAVGLISLWRSAVTWRRRSWGGLSRLPGRAAAIAIASVIAMGGIVDLIPVGNDQPMYLAMRGDRLFDWVRTETDPRSVFLSDIYYHHAILRAGRKIYLGWPAYPYSMGYAMAPREESYRRLLSSRSAPDVVRELQEAGIDYVAFDDGLRQGTYVGGNNESLYAEHLPVVFDDQNNQYANLTIYRVPVDREAWRSLPGALPADAFSGGPGSEPGHLEAPRGLAIAPDGSIIVADTGNDRIQRFGPDGTYQGQLGSTGANPGEFTEPNGVAVDAEGRVYVADLANRVQVFEDGRVVDEWRGGDPGFYGPRDIAIGGDGSVYVLDQGHGRVVRRAPDGSTSSFGSLGSGDGQLSDPTGIASGAALLAVADPLNQRIVVFSDSGEFVRHIPVPEWGPFQYADVALAPTNDAIYATSPATGEILVFTVGGQRTGALREATSHAGPLQQPSAMASRPDGTLLVVEMGANRVALVRP